MENTTIHHIYKNLDTFPGLTQVLKVEDAIRFIRLAAALK